MASLGATKVILILVGILFFMVTFGAFPTTGPAGTNSTALNNTYITFQNNTNALLGSVQSSQNGTAQYGTIINTFIIVQNVFNVLIGAFALVPYLVTNLLSINVVGPFLGLLATFIISISALSWLYGRFVNP